MCSQKIQGFQFGNNQNVRKLTVNRYFDIFLLTDFVQMKLYIFSDFKLSKRNFLGTYKNESILNLNYER